MKKLCFFLVGFLGLISSAFAITPTKTIAYFTDFNFSGEAFGKTVTAVYAHTGSLMDDTQACSPQNRTNHWENVQHVAMTPVGDHFFAKASAVIHTEACSPQFHGPIVQYWVYFEDGSSLVTDAASVTLTTKETRSSSDFISLKQDADAAFKEQTDAPETNANAIVLDFNDL